MTSSSARQPSEASSRTGIRGPSTGRARRRPGADDRRRRPTCHACQAPSLPGPEPATGDGPAQAATADELAALDAMGAGGTWSIGGHEVSLTNLDKVLFPDAGLTKRDLIRYDVSMAPVLLPYLRDRGLTLTRYPNGTGGPHFWEKEVPSHAPAWLSRWRYESRTPEDSHTYAVADRVAALAFLANQAAIELHPWTSRTGAPQRPTYALIDIDPGPKTTWEDVLVLARLYRTALGHLGVRGYPKVTGKRGIQVWIPVEPRYSFAETSAWVEALSRAVGATVPELISWEWSVRDRRGRARLDYTQNASNKTLVAPYSVRPVGTAPVSAPIDWDELDDPELRPDRWTIDDDAGAPGRASATSSLAPSSTTRSCRAWAETEGHRRGARRHRCVALTMPARATAGRLPGKPLAPTSGPSAPSCRHVRRSSRGPLPAP